MDTVSANDFSRRLLVPLAVVGALAITACTDSAAPPPEPPTPTVDSLLLSVDEIREIAQFDQLSADGSPTLTAPQPDPTAPDPCKAVLDQQMIFGENVDEFRTASYGAATGTEPGQISGVAIVTQAIGQYPSAADARAAFNALAPAIEECNGLRVKNYEYRTTAIDNDTLSLHSNVADIVDHVDGMALIHVTVVGLPNSRQIADDVVQRISNRLT